MQRAQSPHGDPFSTTYRGTEPGEQVVLVIRQHPFRVLLGTWPIAIGLIFLVGLLYGQASSVIPGAAWGIAELIVAGITLLLLVRWGVSEAYTWWYTLYIVTDRRVIYDFNGLTRHDTQIPLHKIQATRAITPSLFQWVCGIGTVEIAGAANERIVFADVATPRRLELQILEARDFVAATNGPLQNPVADRALQHVIDAAGKAEPLPTPTALPPAVSTNWPLRRAHHMQLEHDEEPIGIISRHWWALAQQEVIPLGLLATAATFTWLATFTVQSVIGLAALGFAIVGAVWGVLGYLNFADDIFILTTRRIIDVDRHFFVLFETQLAIDYAKIQVVDLEIPSIWARFFGYGDVTVKSSAGNEQDWIRMQTISQPKQIWDAIERSRNAFKQRGDILAANRQRADMKAYLTAVMSEVVANAPDLRMLTLEDAIAAAEPTGLRVMVMGEAVAIPGIAAGLVLSQSPQPGSRCLRGGEISVMLSRM